MNKYILLGISSASLVILVSGCTPSGKFSSGGNKPTWFDTLRNSLGVFSNRDQTSDHFLAIIKLKTPALLENVVAKDGHIEIDSELLKAIEVEQKQTEVELKALSPDIKIIFKYKMVINGFSIVAPTAVLEKLKSIANIAYVEDDGKFSRPVVKETQIPKLLAEKEDFHNANSVKWIGGENLHNDEVKGQNIRVGVIDTGIDYTHAMLGGPGTEAAFNSVDPSQASLFFPNKKVVGGIDLAGTDYDAASADFNKRIPRPDENPIDEAGHGTHVAGTIAGKGDYENSYDGVAPDAFLYAIKVFGANGSTSDSTVLAALEYAADPTGMGTGEDRMDVVNLSLGSAFGSPHILYEQATKNLTAGGTVVVASAGNEGNNDFIVGAPSTVDAALSVAASVDNSVHNWKFSAVKVTFADGTSQLTEAIQGPISLPIAEASKDSGRLLYVGLADTDFSEEVKAQLVGKIAFVDRGKVMFTDKMRRVAEAGAIGMVVANNQPGDAFAMGGDGHWDIPAVMITQALGANIQSALKTGEVDFIFNTNEKIEKPELIDTITSFSSKGPRSQDGVLKPEITAPGSDIISAAIGKGSKTVAMSGTSMSGPHVAGAMALLRQTHMDLTVAELKSIAMGRSVSIADKNKVIYPVSRQGAGRVQVDHAVDTPVVASRPSISLGLQNVESKKVIREKIAFRNISSEVQEFKVVFEGSHLMQMTGPSQLTLNIDESVELSLRFILDLSNAKERDQELDGWIKLIQDNKEIYRVPVLAVVRRVSQIASQGVFVRSTGVADEAGAAVDMKFINTGLNSGRVMLFNYLGGSGRKADPTHDIFKSNACDLKDVGYRVLDKEVLGAKTRVLQVVASLYSPMTTWNTCELSVLIDSNGDDIPDQELAFTSLGYLKGLSNGSNDNQQASLLLDAGKAREIRRNYELAIKAGGNPKEAKENYEPALLGAIPTAPLNISNIVLVEADISLLKLKDTGELAIKVATIHDDASAVQTDDYMGDNIKNWKQISVQEDAQGFVELPEVITLGPGEGKNIEATKGEGSEPLLILFPDNRLQDGILMPVLQYGI